MLFLAIRAASSDLVQAVTTALVTIVVLFAIVVIVGFTILRRRRRRAELAPARVPGPPSGETDLSTRANILLVRLDDAVAQADDNLGFAVAQFGEERSRAFAEALSAARRDLTESFRLKHRLDDSQPDTATQQREWNARIIHLCETAQKALADEAAAFDALRRRETDAPTELGKVRMLVVTASMRVPAAESALSALAGRYSPDAIAPVAGNVAEARALLTTAGQGAEAANARLADPLATDVADRVQEARATATTALRLLEAVDALGATLAEQSDRLDNLASQSRVDLTEARVARDSAPDPSSAAAIGGAVTAVESVLGSLDTGDPAASLSRLEGAVASLDSALASARNQTQRLEHAGAALAGVLVSARSQIAATQDFIASRRGGVGADARSRLAEAQRLLEVAEAQSDPVAALDSARSSATYSRDADALARFDAHR
ncbi:hypothetical protein F1C58_13175 [Glaciihabitans sp. INWT7]|uniref:hypothetical protein n=1 Tax=Glaciihabitans sp. INWT7 TaxID=2596912 RepID=UPI00162A09CD|nr:hypothetical protein [Glaciihabitans sp. INWT7]QNE47751.1 hypothetical protein F1C58_13175 [Glaciihabitans sp. INWT7]